MDFQSFSIGFVQTNSNFNFTIPMDLDINITKLLNWHLQIDVPISRSMLQRHIYEYDHDVVTSVYIWFRNVHNRTSVRNNSCGIGSGWLLLLRNFSIFFSSPFIFVALDERTHVHSNCSSIKIQWYICNTTIYLNSIKTNANRGNISCSMQTEHEQRKWNKILSTF